MHDIDEMIVRTSKQLPAPAAAHHPSSALVVAVAPSWTARRPGASWLWRLETGVAAPPTGLTPAPDDARGRRGLPRGGLTVVGPGAAPAAGGSAAPPSTP